MKNIQIRTVLLTLALGAPLFSIFLHSAAKGPTMLKSKKELSDAMKKNRHKSKALKFEADWCGACKMLTEPFMKAHAKHAHILDVYSIDADNPEFRDLQIMLGITGLPTVVYIKPVVGTRSQTEIEGDMASLAGGRRRGVVMTEEEMKKEDKEAAAKAKKDKHEAVKKAYATRKKRRSK